MIALGIVLFGIGYATGPLGIFAFLILAGGYIVGFELNDLEINILKLVVALAGVLAYNYFDKNKQDGIRNSQMAAKAAGTKQVGGKYPDEAMLQEAARNDLGVPLGGGDGDGKGGRPLPSNLNNMDSSILGDSPIPTKVGDQVPPAFSGANSGELLSVLNLPGAKGDNKPSEKWYSCLKGYGTMFSLTVAAVAFAATYIVHILRQRRVCKERVESKTPEGKTVEKEVNRPINWTSPIFMAACVALLTSLLLLGWSCLPKLNTKDLTSLKGLRDLILRSGVKGFFLIPSLIIKFFSSLAHPNIEKFKNFKGASVLELLLANISDNPNIGETPVVAVGSFISAGLGYAFTNLFLSRKC